MNYSGAENNRVTLSGTIIGVRDGKNNNNNCEVLLKTVNPDAT